MKYNTQALYGYRRASAAIPNSRLSARSTFDTEPQQSERSEVQNVMEKSSIECFAIHVMLRRLAGDVVDDHFSNKPTNITRKQLTTTHNNA